MLMPFARSFQHLLGMLNLQGYESNPVLLLASQSGAMRMCRPWVTGLPMNRALVTMFVATSV